MCERTLTHQFAKWAKVDNLAEALCWMILKGGGKGVPGRTFKAFEELQSLADSPDGGSDTTSDGGSDTTSSLADVNRDLENIVLDDDPPRPTSLQATLPMAVPGTNGTAESATASRVRTTGQPAGQNQAEIPQSTTTVPESTLPQFFGEASPYPGYFAFPSGVTSTYRSR